MKQFILFSYFLFISLISAYPIETERTIWIPWTIEHSQEWEIIEQNDTSASYFRRNEYFESMDELIRRDSNWLKLCKYIQNQHKEEIFFPDLGFAIIRKTDQKLIGSLKVKLSNQSGIVSFGYGLRPEVRNEKLGQEIISTFISYIHTIIGKSILSLKNDKSIFMAEWYNEGKKEEPNLEHLASFFSSDTQSLKNVIGSVDTQNPASLAILIRNFWQPISLACDKYICEHNEQYVCYDFLLRYPSNSNESCEKVELLAYDMLSRNEARIQAAYQRIEQLFHIDNSWKYPALSRAEKAVLQPVEKKSSFYDCSTIKSILERCYYPPYCFIE